MNSEETSPGPRPAPHGRGLYYTLGGLLSVIAAWFFYGPVQIRVGVNVDASHVWTVAWAFQNGYAWGSDILFTYGPLGFLRAQTFLPEGGWVPVALAYGYYGLLGFLFWRIFKPFTGESVGGTLFALSALVLSSLFFVAFDAVIFFIIMAGAYLCMEDEAFSPLEALCFFIFCALNAYVKYTFTIAVIFLFFFLLAYWLIERRKGYLVWMLPAAMALGAWVAGFNPYSLFQYLIHTWPVASGYSKAMLIWGEQWEWLVFLGMMVGVNLLYFASLIRRRPWRLFILYVLWISLICFFAWKLGFVRHDAHAGIAATFLLLVALFWVKDSLDARWGSLAPPRFIVLFLLVGLVLGTAYFVSLQRQYFGDDFFGKRVQAFVRQPVATFHTRVMQPLDREAMREELARRMERIRNAIPLPIPIDGTVDFYDHRSGILLAHDLDYHPRPLFQSYSAYTPGLIRKNRDHLLKPDAPQYLFTDLGTVNQRPAMLGDGLSWLEIFRRYEPVARERRLLVWQRIPEADAKAAVSLELVAEETGRLREDILLDEWTGEPLWVELDFKPGWGGRLQNLLFKPSPLQMEVALGNERRILNQIAPGMTKTGFLLSPHIVEPEALEHFLSMRGTVGYNPWIQWVHSFRILEERHLLRTFWKDFTYRLYRLRLEDIPAQESPYLAGMQSRLWNGLEGFANLRIEEAWDPPRVVDRHEQMPSHLFAHAPLRFSIENQWGGSEVKVTYGLYDGSWQEGNATDGVVFRIWGVEENGEVGRLLWEADVNPLEVEADRGVQRARIGIPESYSHLMLETDKKGNPNWDWSYWGPVLEIIDNDEP